MKASTRPSVGRRVLGRLGNFVESLKRGEKVAERFTCRTVRLNLKPSTYNAQLVRETRGKLSASQTVFAQFLGVSPSTVRDWEQGIKSPQPIACRLMDEIRRDPEYWLGRLQELAIYLKT